MECRIEQPFSVQAEAFTNSVWSADDLVEIRYFPADRESPLRPFSTFYKAGQVATISERVEEHNEKGYHVSAGILPRRARGGMKDEDCLGGWAIWSDFDGVAPDAACRAVESAGMKPPTIIIASGHGAHLYWRVTDRIDADVLTKAVADLAAWIGSDEAVANRSRVMRLPGTINWKAPVAKCEVRLHNPDTIYDFEALRAIIPNRPQAVHAPSRSTPATTDVETRARKYVAAIPGAAEGSRNHAAYKVACVLVRDFDLADADAWPILLGWDISSNVPPLSSGGDRELRGILDSARKHAKQTPGAKAETPLPLRVSGRRPAGERPRVAQEKAEPAVVEAAHGTADMQEELAQQRSPEMRRIALPWKHLDEETRALRAGSVTVLCGPPGAGKSFMTAHIALGVHEQGVRWAYLPLEGRAVDLKFRFLAIFAGDYRMIDDEPETVALRDEAFAREQDRLDELAPFLLENPRVGRRNEMGEMIVPPLYSEMVVDWIRKAADGGARVLFVDPVSQIEFPGRRSWEAEADFIRKVLAIAADTRSTIFLVTHPVKRPGKASTESLVLDDLQGSAMYGRLCHCAIMLDAHDWRESDIKRPGNTRSVCEHNRTILLAKTRHGAGTRKRVAFVQGSDAPSFEEIGVVAGKSKGSAF